MMKQYELNLGIEELEKRTHKDYLVTKKMIDENRTKNGNLNVVLQIDPDMFAVL